MNELPLPPAEVSGNGQEIWDWAAKLSEATQRSHERRQLNQALADCGTRCGDCYKWMKSSMCPAERNVNGRNHGPSCQSRKCGQYQEDQAATKRRSEIAAKLVELGP